MSRSIVAAVKTTPGTVLRDIESLMTLAGMQTVLAKGVKTILKDNISWHFPFLSANTTPWQLEGTIKALHAAGYTDLVSVHNNTVVTDPYRGQELNKLAPLYKKYGVEEKYNFKPEDIRWISYKPKAPMIALDKIFPEGIHIPEYFIGKNIVHLPTMKTHIYTTTTGAMKNAFGGLLNTRRHYTHTWIHETLVDLLAIQQEIHPGIFAVMDGTLCGSGPGPRTMIPVEKNLVLASADQVAIDAVAAKMMGFDPMTIPYLRMAHERKLGCADPRDIRIEGEDVTTMNFGFSVGDNLASRAGDVFWFGPLRFLQKLLFHTPLVYVFVYASFFYHDYFWWPVKGKPLMEKIRRTSQWGTLFESYGSTAE